jgi:hypothetical protein
MTAALDPKETMDDRKKLGFQYNAGSRRLRIRDW